MRYRILGKTGLQVSELAMGGAFITERAAARADGIAAVRRALQLGINFVDTAAGYSDSEEVFGLALDGVPQPYILCPPSWAGARSRSMPATATCCAARSTTACGS